MNATSPTPRFMAQAKARTGGRVAPITLVGEAVSYNLTLPHDNAHSENFFNHFWSHPCTNLQSPI